MKKLKQGNISNFNFSQKKYSASSSSNHWRYNNRKKVNLFDEKNLINFRKNGLSYGMDDQFYNKKNTRLFFTELLNLCGEKFISKLLEKKNIGNPTKYFRYKK